jgi:hypothetical protein
MLPILFIFTLLLLWAILIWAYISFFQLIQVQIEEFPEEWNNAGQPFGTYLNRKKTKSYFRSGCAGPWQMMLWTYKTPSWVHQSKRASALLWQYRALSWIYTIGFIVWAAIFLFSVIAP